MTTQSGIPKVADGQLTTSFQVRNAATVATTSQMSQASAANKTRVYRTSKTSIVPFDPKALSKAQKQDQGEEDET